MIREPQFERKPNSSTPRAHSELSSKSGAYPPNQLAWHNGPRSFIEKMFAVFLWLPFAHDRQFAWLMTWGLACHGEPFDMLLWKTRILEQIKCLKDSAMNESANHQIPFLCNISQRSGNFQIVSKLLMHVNIPIIVGWYPHYKSSSTGFPTSHAVMGTCPGTGDQEADAAPWGSTRVIRWVNELVGWTRTPHHRHDATRKRMNSSASKIMIVRLAMVQFCDMCSESPFEDV